MIRDDTLLVRSVGALVHCPPTSKLRPAVERALTLCDAVHGVACDYPSLPIRAVNRGRTLYRVGSYSYQALLINSWYSDDSRVSAVLHELGHHLDYQAFGRSSFASEDANGPFAEVVELATNSAPAAEIRARIDSWQERIARCGAELATLPEITGASYADWVASVSPRAELGKRMKQGESSIKGWGRLLEPKELWARAYEQWVVTEAATLGYADAVARWYPPARPGLDHEQRWSHAEFAPIAAAIDRVFAAGGWLAPQPAVRQWRSGRC